MKNSQFCFTHNPEVSEEKKIAVKKGGLSPKKNALDLSPLKIKNAQNVLRLLEDTINRVRAGEVSVKIANCIGYLSGYVIKALEISEIEKRVKKLEEIASQR